MAEKKKPKKFKLIKSFSKKGFKPVLKKEKKKSLSEQLEEANEKIEELEENIEDLRLAIEEGKNEKRIEVAKHVYSHDFIFSPMFSNDVKYAVAEALEMSVNELALELL